MCLKLIAQVIALAFEISGTILLAREVIFGHSMEEIGAGVSLIQEKMICYTKGDFIGYYILVHLFIGWSMTQIQEELQNNSSQQIEEFVKMDWSGLSPNAAESVKRWFNKTTEKAMEKRKRFVRLGAALLIAGAITHFVIDLY